MTEFSELERLLIVRAKSRGWQVVQAELSPGVKTYQLRDEVGNSRQNAQSEPECWKLALVSGVLK